MSDDSDPFNGLDLQEIIDLAVDAPGHQGQTLEIVPSQPIPLGKAEIYELD